MKILAITNLFPNSKEPTRGMYNKQQFLELAKLCELKVVAPVPWYSNHEIAEKEEIDGIDVFHPRYFMIPKVGRSLYGLFFYLSLKGFVKKIRKDFNFDLIFATWAYPDGFGSFLIAKLFKKPVVIKVHGSDINLHTKYFLRRKMISYALRNSDKVIAVSNALMERMVEIGVPRNKINVIPNGIDPTLFFPMDKAECRAKLGLPIENKVVIFVGNLVSVKGVENLLEAISIISEEKESPHLVIVGDGKQEDYLKKKSGALRIQDKVYFVGRKAHAEIPIWLNAADVLCLPSLNEGCPNVALEAMACGRPVVASKVGGLTDIIASTEAGILVEPKNSDALTQGLIKALDKSWDSRVIKEEAVKFSWKDSAGKLKKELDVAIRLFSTKDNSTIRKYYKSFFSAIIPKRIIMWKLRNSRKIALTFDDGPNQRFTPLVLDILKEKDIKATFFLIGKEVEKDGDLTRRIVNEGHIIGLHSYSHNRFKELKLMERMKEIRMTREVFKKATHMDIDVFRPPQGTISFSQLFYCLKEGLTTVLWSMDSGDFKHMGFERIVDNIAGNGIKGGEIILFHDDNEFTIKALPEIIDYLKERNFEFSTVEELWK